MKTSFFSQETDIASLTFFRFCAGILMSIELIFTLYLGDFHEYAHTGFHFTYQWFPWIKPLPELGMKILFTSGIVAGFFVSLGFLYRLASTVLFLVYTSLFLMEATQYVNHMYLYCLISFWMILIPLNLNFSLDAYLSKKSSQTIPLWMLRLLQTQIAIMYFYAALAKIHPDWLSARLTASFLAVRGIHSPLMAQSMVWGGIFFDLFIIPLLIFKPTRKLAIIGAIFFHISNVTLFGLGSFPWFALMSCTLFFSPEWPRKFLSRFFQDGRSSFNTSKLMEGFVCVYVLVQVVVPLRQHLYPHDAGWSEEGHNYSWRMKTRIKRGELFYQAVDKVNGSSWEIYPREFLTAHQNKDLQGHPDYILQFAHYLRDQYKKEGKNISIYAHAKASLNGHPYQELIDPKVDLGEIKAGLLPYTWIRKQFGVSESSEGAANRVFRSGNKGSQRSVPGGAALEAHTQRQ